MGGQQSQPQLLGVSGGGGGFGKIAEALAPKVAFDTNTGELVVAGPGQPRGETFNGMRLNLNQTGGWSAAILPTDGVDLGQYIDNITKYMKQGQLQNPGVYPMTVNMMAFDAIGTQVGVESIGQPSAGAGNPAGAKVLPMVTAYQIKNPPVRAVVYTDKAGVSKFLYKNDPGNAVQLVPNGSKIAAGASQQKSVEVSQQKIAAENAIRTCMHAVLDKVGYVNAAQKNEIITGVNECSRVAMSSNTAAAAPAPASPVVAPGGESTYAVQGEMYPIQATGGGYPMWLIILIIAILTGVLIFVKNS